MEDFIQTCICFYIYICLYIHTHAYIVVKSGDADCLSLLDRFSWLIPVPVLYFCDLFFGRNCVACGKCRMLTFSRCDERPGAGGGVPNPGVPSLGVELSPPCPAGNFAPSCGKPEGAPVWSGPEQGVAYPTRQVSVEVVSEGGRRRGLAAGLCSGTANPTHFWESLPRSGVWVRSHTLIVGQPRQGLCPQCLNIASRLELYCGAWSF